MRITEIQCHRLPVTTLLPAIPRNLIEYTLVRVLTDEGIDGNYIVWSETPAARPQALAEGLRQMRPYLIGCDPLLIEHIWQKLGMKKKDLHLRQLTAACGILQGKKPIFRFTSFSVVPEKRFLLMQAGSRRKQWKERWNSQRN